MKSLFLLFTILLLALALPQSLVAQGSGGSLPAPVNTTPLFSQTICSGQTTVLSASGSGNLTWYDQPAQGSLLGSGNSFTTSVLNASETFWVQDNSSTISARTAIPVTVNSSPVISITSSSNAICTGGSVTLSATGSDISSYSWLPDAGDGPSITVSPLETTTYSVTGTSSNGCTGVDNKTIDVTPCSLSYSVKLFLQGYYKNAGIMEHVLYNQAVSGSTLTMTDSVTIQFRNTIAPYEVIYSFKTILYTNGIATVLLPSSSTSYYLVVKERNGLETWSKDPVSPSLLSATYNFSSNAGKAYGDNLIETEPGIWAVYSGDLYQDENIDLIDINLLEASISNFEFGNVSTDINGDGNVDLMDFTVIELNVSNFVFSGHP